MITDSPVAVESRPGWPGGKWRALLVASLALNLIVAGLTASTVWRQRHHTNAPARTEELGLQGFLRQLPRERAKELRALIKDEKPDLKPFLEATREARRNAADVLEAPTFDKNSLTTAFARIDAAEANVKAAARSAVVAAAGHMTLEERAALAERWKAKRAKFFGGSGPKQSPNSLDDKTETHPDPPATP